MSEDREYSLDEVAQRFRRAATAEPAWSEPSAGTWEAIAAATGIEVEPPPSPAPAPGGVGRRGLLLGGAGMLAGIALGVAGAVALGALDDLGETILRAVLTPLDRPDETLGTAELRERETGYSLSVEVPDGVANPDGYVEVWLINSDGQRMVSIGVFPADTVGRFIVDPSLIEAGYVIVDLSNERFDDEPRHSGDTIMRGQLVRD
ncbi:anti-sigma factor [Tessaracoccus oleiagri]|uniref:Anti-sigma-K factor rskA n=1 Tax=Tessaracoccus oleiagri TaxID=686624 RepID=A0A1G9LQ51_9ACTN|nr:anti-sigma factor [Tessaracoccus oleiagri]SDL64056.1 Anti-sigma-K factor rskA [Tessaracoccus oleiagri]